MNRGRRYGVRPPPRGWATANVGAALGTTHRDESPQLAPDGAEAPNWPDWRAAPDHKRREEARSQVSCAAHHTASSGPTEPFRNPFVN